MDYYETLICGGPFGIAGRIIGAKMRKLTKRERRGFRALLDAGYTVQIISPDQATWERNKPAIYRELGLAS